MRKRLDQPRQAQDEPHGKVLFTFLGGLACDLEGLGAGAERRLLTYKVIHSLQIYNFLNNEKIAFHRKDVNKEVSSLTTARLNLHTVFTLLELCYL
jgi:hypothetical protein